MTETTNWDHVSYVLASSYRTAILHALTDGPQTPTELGENTGLDIAHVSRSLSDLRSKDLAELLVSEETKKGRIYASTDAGKDVDERLLERGVEP